MRPTASDLIRALNTDEGLNRLVHYLLHLEATVMLIAQGGDGIVGENYESFSGDDCVRIAREALK